ncbi:hypothetical protein Lal_00014527 [Lupinus albus]|nr:hypothetical protein Lal_00014527 [Lupinus albus]
MRNMEELDNDLFLKKILLLTLTRLQEPCNKLLRLQVKSTSVIATSVSYLCFDEDKVDLKSLRPDTSTFNLTKT